MKSKASSGYFDIGSSSNDNYAQHLGIMMYSLLSNCSRPEKVRFFIVDGGISEGNKEKMRKVTSTFGAKLTFAKPNYETIKGLKVCRYLGVETYHRFSLIEETKVSRLFYLDCDLVVCGDVAEIFELDIKKDLVCAVEDILINDEKKKSLGIKPSKPYFNAGVLFINCDKWRKDKVSNRVIDYIRKNPEKINMADQDGLNAVLKDKWRQLDPSWNVIARTLVYKKIAFMFNEKYREKFERLDSQVNIVHFAGHPKPWRFWHFIPMKSEYWRNLKQSPWKNYRYPDANIQGLFKEISSLTNTIIQKIRNGNLL